MAKKQDTNLERYADLCAARALHKRNEHLTPKERTTARDAAKGLTTGPTIRAAVEAAFRPEPASQRQPVAIPDDLPDPSPEPGDD